MYGLGGVNHRLLSEKGVTYDSKKARLRRFCVVFEGAFPRILLHTYSRTDDKRLMVKGIK